MRSYSEYSRKELVDKLNLIVNTKVNDLGKKIDSPLEVEFFPHNQIPKITLSLYKQIMKIKNLPSEFPPKDTLIHNINTLVKHSDPELIQEIHKRGINVLHTVIYDQSYSN